MCQKSVPMVHFGPDGIVVRLFTGEADVGAPARSEDEGLTALNTEADTAPQVGCGRPKLVFCGFQLWSREDRTFA